MLINKAADKLVFKFLSKIKNGYLEITTHDGEILKFGDPAGACPLLKTSMDSGYPQAQSTLDQYCASI